MSTPLFESDSGCSLEEDIIKLLSEKSLNTNEVCSKLLENGYRSLRSRSKHIFGNFNNIILRRLNTLKTYKKIDLRNKLWVLNKLDPTDLSKMYISSTLTEAALDVLCKNGREMRLKDIITQIIEGGFPLTYISYDILYDIMIKNSKIIKEGPAIFRIIQ